MNVLQICSVREIGGGERHLIDLVNGLHARGHNVHAAIPHNSPLREQLASLPSSNVLETRMGNAADLLSARRIVQFACERSIDVIHAHAARDYLIAAVASRWSSGIPFVLTRHVLFPMSQLHRVTLRRVSRVIAVSTAVASSLKQQRIFDPAKIVAIPNGVDVDHFDVKSKRTGGSGRFQIGIIGHLSPIKGQDQFLQAASRVISTRDDVDLMIVGEDKSRSGENRRAIERVIDELGLGDRVRMTGWVDDVRDVLATIDLLVSAARSEPFGLVIAEAMAAGVPVIATSTESATEIIEDGVTGRLVSIGDPTALAAAITELLSHEKMRRSLATNALGSVRTNFSLNRMVTATEDLYSAIVLA